MSDEENRIKLKLSNIRNKERHIYLIHCKLEGVDRGEAISNDIRAMLKNRYSSDWVAQGIAEFNENPKSREFNNFSHVKYVDDHERMSVAIPNVRAEDRYLFNKHCALNNLDRGEEISIIMMESLSDRMRENLEGVRSRASFEQICIANTEQRQDSTNQSSGEGCDKPFDDLSV